jgi:hypothetical protein
VPDLISDEAFYRLVACAAPPGGDCAKPFIRWPRERRLRLRVGIAQIAEGFADYRLDLVDRSVDRAIAEINGAGAHLYLERAYEGPFDIPIYLVDAPQGGEIAGTGVADLDGTSISIGRVALRSRGRRDHRGGHRDLRRHPAARDRLGRAGGTGAGDGACHRCGFSGLLGLDLFGERQFHHPTSRPGRRRAPPPLPAPLIRASPSARTPASRKARPHARYQDRSGLHPHDPGLPP